MQANGQISGQMAGQVTSVSRQSTGSPTWRTWQTDSDVGVRRMIVEKILQLFQKRKPQVSPEWQQKLPEFVRRLEESLYRDASSKEEYSDLLTLEHRLQAVARRITPFRNSTAYAARGSSVSSSSMIPTPGVPSTLKGSTMIPTPGNEMTIMPTPGISVSGTSGGASLLQGRGMAIGSSNMDTSGTLPLQQSFNATSSGHMYRNMNGQLGGNVVNNMQRKSPMSYGFVNGGTSNGMQMMGNEQHLVGGGTPSYLGTNLHNNAVQYGSNAAPQPQQLMNEQQRYTSMQSRMPGAIPGDGYVVNATDVSGQGGSYNSGSAGLSGSGMGLHSQGPQVSKMIPVPGLSSQHTNLLPQHPSQYQGVFQHKVSGAARAQLQQQQLHKVKAGYPEPCGKTKMTAALLPEESLASQFQPSADQQQSSHLQHVQNPMHQQQSKHVLKERENQEQVTVHMESTMQPRWHQEPQGQETEQQGFRAQPQQHHQHQHQSQPLSTQHQPSSQGQSNPLPNVLPQTLQDAQQAQSMAHSSLEPPQQQDASLTDADDPPKSQQVASNDAVMVKPTIGLDGPNAGSNSNANNGQRYLKQQRWLLFLRHASRCNAPEGQCQTTPHCHTARQLWFHIKKCSDRECQFPRCQPSRTLMRHHQFCRDVQCPVCGPVRQKFHVQHVPSTIQGQAVQAINSASSSAGGSQVASLSGVTNHETSSMMDFQPPPAKRSKVEPSEQADVHQGASPGNAKSQHSFVMPSQPQVGPSVAAVIKTEANTVSVKFEGGSGVGNVAVKSESHGSSLTNAAAPMVTQLRCMPLPQQHEIEPEVKATQPSLIQRVDSGAVTSKASLPVKQEVKQEAMCAGTSSPGHESASNSKSNKPKIKGVSLTELFTPEQIREHILGLRQWVGQSKAKAEKNQAMESRMSENSCQLCAVETLTFEPPPIYCTPCGARIKRNAFYWTMQSGETRHYFCIPCYNDARSDTVEIDGIHHAKSKLEKRKNDEETEEPWVQCDKCEKWQHQVCALFNLRRNEGGQAEYTCPHCLMGEVERGERKPLPQSAVLGAKDLPRTLLSDHIEQRLARRLKHERHERARSQGKSYEEVPGADSWVIRIVSSVDKKLEVKQRFLEIFQEEDYPIEFPYKSKVLLLFQKIEGVEVCLFGMYVQEFGADSAQPNQRRVYLSYLDSVKYFRPDVRTVHGEALRTFVYHEILIGYLDYCKKRGFTSCYIWACPPLKGEDYILYCHPEIQKTPRSDKLREWYLTMLRKATAENIVMEVTNMYDHFFVCTGEAKAKVTAARLPYFDGDYWPGAAEDMIMQLQEEEIGRRQQKKGKTKKTATKRATKSAAQAELASNASKDLQLMHKLGESIFPMKEDFIMVHLQYACTHCCNFILLGRQWNCKHCKNFHLCDSCYDLEQKLEDRDRHPATSKEAHPLYSVDLLDPLPDTKDKDEITESEFFDTRQAFLSLCQGNHYQYDTLRRAKHSSMMVLYHLHNPTAPAFVTTCNMCHRDIETGQGWRCETCPDFDLCNACYSKDDSVKHPHKLSPHPSAAEREAQSKEARQQRVLQLRKMLDLLVHASQCGSAQCQYPNCRRVKGLFRHGMICKTRASGGCHLCKKMWYLLQLHARACKESECRVPRCRDLKEHLRRLQRQMESRRRAAVKEMMRQRTAEAAAGAS